MIPPELRFLVEAERSRPKAPAEARAHAQVKLAALLGPAAGLGGGGGGDGGGGGSARPTGTAAGAGAGAAVVKGAAGLTAAKVLAVFAMGGLVGGGVTTAIRKPAERIVYVERAVPTASAVASPAPVPAAKVDIVPPVPSAPPASPAPAASAPRRLATTPSAPSFAPVARARDTDLAAERAVIERARSALARGDGQGALGSIAEHERTFAHGQLVEEREVLAVQSLVTAGRVQEAATRAARFRKAFPHSLLLPLVDQALR